MTRTEMKSSLTRSLGSGFAALHVLAILGHHGEYKFTRTDAYGVLHWRARRYEDGTYALDKIPA